MIRVARERIDDLFGLAESEARRGGSALPDRYVELARRVGMRYNVRLRREFRDLYCRRCSAYWVEGRTVRTRLRRGRRVETCLKCGHARRVPLHPRPARGAEADLEGPGPADREEAVFADDFEGSGPGADAGEEE